MYRYNINIYGKCELNTVVIKKTVITYMHSSTQRHPGIKNNSQIKEFVPMLHSIFVYIKEKKKQSRLVRASDS